MDDRLRSLEREGSDDLRWLTEAQRVGRLPRERVLAAAYLGHPAARVWWDEGSALRPRWRHEELPPWTPSPRSLTEQLEQADDDAMRELLRGAAAQAALGRLELPALQLDEHPDTEVRILRVPRRDGDCLVLHWLASVAFDLGRSWPEDLAAVADMMVLATLEPVGPDDPDVARLGLPLVGSRRAWRLAGRSTFHPLPLLLETEAELVVVSLAAHIASSSYVNYSPFRARVARLLRATGEDLQVMAARLAELGAPDDAERVLTAELERLPGDLELRLARAGLRARSGAPAAAVEDFAQGARLETRPAQRADWLLAHGRALLRCDRLAEALASLEEARRVRSDSPTLSLLATVRRLTGDAAGARVAAQEALARAPYNEEALHEAKLTGV